MKIYVTILFLLFSGHIWAQQVVPNLARVGGKGIFVLTGEKISDVKGPITGYRIARKAGNDTEYKEVAYLKAVPTLAEFRKNFAASTRFLPYNHELSAYKVDSIWMIGKRTNQLIALKAKGYSLPVLAGFNMIWLDDKVVEGVVYQYRVTAEGGTYAALSEMITYKRVMPVAAVSYERGLYNQPQRQMLLYWRAAGKDKPVHMEVFRSESDDTRFIKVPASVSFYPGKDTFQYQVKDQSAIPGRLYRYFVNSYDALGNAAPSSDTISIASLDYIQMPLPRQVKMQSDSTSRGIRIDWQLPSAPLLQELTLYRSETSGRGFKQVSKLAIDQQTFTDEDVTPSKPYFYYFEVKYKTIDKPKKTTTFSGLYINHSRPLTPQNITANSTRTGLEITWEHESRNITGFWLYRAERGNAMKLVSTMIHASDTAMRYSYVDVDSSLNGGKFYEYAVKAVSSSHIESLFSDTVVVRPMMNQPVPMPPIQVSTTVDENRILVFWDAVSGYDENVSNYILIRSTKIPGTKETYKHDSVYCSTNMYVDSAVRHGQIYRYTVLSQSIFGRNSRPSNTVTARVDKPAPASPSSVVANYTSKGVLLQWESPADSNQLHYAVYRYERGTNPLKLGTARNNQQQYLDPTARKGKQYFYFVRAISDGDEESVRSNEAMVKL